MLPRWERHWWEWIEIQTAAEREPTVWVDPSLYVETSPPPRQRFPRGSAPPPSVIGAYCALRPRLMRRR